MKLIFALKRGLSNHLFDIETPLKTPLFTACLKDPQSKCPDCCQRPNSNNEGKCWHEEQKAKKLENMNVSK